jgi:Ankyrin repeats (many copies)
MGGDNNLHKAAHKGDLDECKKYVEGTDGEDKLDVNEPGASDRRALHRSAGAGHLPLCEYFVAHEAVIDLVRSSTKSTCMELVHIAELLIIFHIEFCFDCYHS